MTEFSELAESLINSILAAVDEIEKEGLSEGFCTLTDEAINECKRHNIKLKIWLGGPGRQHDCYRHRILFRELLETRCFEVIMSETYPGVGMLQPAKETLVDAYRAFLCVVLCMSPGSISEAVLFALCDETKQRLQVFIPKTWDDGFTYMLLHDLLPGMNFVDDFEFDEFQNCDVQPFARFCVRLDMLRAQFFPQIREIQEHAPGRGFEFP